MTTRPSSHTRSGRPLLLTGVDLTIDSFGRALTWVILADGAPIAQISFLGTGTPERFTLLPTIVPADASLRIELRASWWRRLIAWPRPAKVIRVQFVTARVERAK